MPASQLPININASALQMADTIFGTGATVISASYTGDPISSGVYSNGNAVSPDATPGDTGIILSTGRARDYTNSSGAENQSSATSTNTDGPNFIPSFNAQSGTPTLDTAYLDVDFIPGGDVLTMQFVFASEEYPEFQNSIYQDFVAVWVNGQPIDISVGNGDIDPGNVNSDVNENLYLDNAGGNFNTEMDGLTVTLTLKMPVIIGELNSIRIGIADVADSNYDSNLLIAADSVQTSILALDDSVTFNRNETEVVDVLANDSTTSTGSLVITHINNVPVTAGSIVSLSTGASVQLNGDGTITVIGDGDTEDYNFAYTISDGFNSDTGIVNVSQVPCFVAGTLISTPDGDVPVEQLLPGDLVLTKDDGPQPLRWSGQRRVEARGDFAPIWIRANTFGKHGSLLVSPLHRILIKDALADVLFGEDEVLIAARDLINDHSVCRREGGDVRYVHLLFDRHQVVFSEGLATESFLPGPQTTSSFEAEMVQEICSLFPQLDPDTCEGYGPSARRSLRRFEAELLLKRRAVA
jgi:hypothetical protein